MPLAPVCICTPVPSLLVTCTGTIDLAPDNLPVLVRSSKDLAPCRTTFSLYVEVWAPTLPLRRWILTLILKDMYTLSL